MYRQYLRQIAAKPKENKNENEQRGSGASKKPQINERSSISNGPEVPRQPQSTSHVASPGVTPSTSTVASPGVTPSTSTVASPGVTPSTSTVASTGVTPSTSTVASPVVTPSTSTVANGRATNPQPSTAVSKQEAPKPKPVAMSKEQKEKHQKDLAALKKQADDLMKMINDTMGTLQTSVKKDMVLQGNVSAKFSSPAKIIRIFTSSTFTDTKHERNRMMEKTFPRLKAYCQQKGFEFQIVDMRWGIRDEATNDHMTTEICLQELDNCQKYSAGPNFLSLLSHKYGYRSLPRQINAEEYENIIKYVDSTDARQLLSKWFIRDDNAVPPQYILHPISTHIPDYINQGEKEKQEAAKKQWWAESDLMFEALVTAAEKALPHEEAHKFKISVTHTEIMHGLLNQDLVDKKCIWLQRNIKDIEEQKPSNLLSRFTECVGATEKLQTVKSLIADLKSNMTQKLPADNILSYDVQWQETGIDPTSADHNAYLDQITGDAEEKLKQMVNKIIGDTIQQKTTPVKDEYKQHLLFCQSKCDDFEGKKDTLNKVHEYMKGKSKYPLVIHGESGSGKTSLMAMIAKKSWEWFDGKATVIVRFCGTTPNSSNLLDLLTSITGQIRSAKSMAAYYPKGMNELLILFKQTLLNVKDPLVIVLDSLDQLDPAYNARMVGWLPNFTVGLVRFVVSTLEDPKYEVFPNLQGKYPKESFLPVATISNADISLILDHWLNKKKRILTSKQRELILNMYNQCPLPLYLNLCFLEASKWTSSMNMSDVCLYNTVREAINGLFSKLERSHGQIFVSKALGYLTAAKIGLTETELEDILACDDEVLNDVYVYWTPPIRRLPPLLLVRLRYDLQQYLVERGADSVTVVYWYHRQFIEAAQERYCTDKTNVTSLHSSLADFFSGTWANGNKKPFVNSDGETQYEDRHVVPQPIKFGDVYNIRKLNNLPYHLTMSGRIDQLKKECLLNVEFLYSKLECSSLRSMIEDFDVAMKVSKDEQIDVILQAIHLSEDAVLYNSDQFMPQMFLRLSDIKDLRKFTEACRQMDVPYLNPNTNDLIKPGGPLVYALAGHKYQVDWVDMKQDGKMAVTISAEDHSLGIWDINEGRLIRMLDHICQDPVEVNFVANDSIILIYAYKEYLAITEFGQKLYSINHTKVSAYCICGKNKEILVCFMKSRTIELYDIKTGVKTDEIDTSSYGKSKSLSFGCTIVYGSENFAICTNDDDLRIWVVDIKKKKAYLSEKIVFPVTPAIQDEEDDVQIDAGIICKDEKHLIVSNIYDNIPYMIDIKTFAFGKSFPGNDEDVIQKYMLSKDGKKMYGSTYNDVLVIDMESGTRTKVVNHNDGIDCVISRDLVTFLTVSADCILRVWDTRKNTATKNDTENLGKSVAQFTVLPNGRYVLLQVGSKEKKLVVYDTIAKKIISQANLKARIKDNIVLDNRRAVVYVATAEKGDPLDMHLIDLEKMTAKPIQGKTNKDFQDLVKINFGKEFLLPTRSGKNVKIYDMETQTPKEVIKLPETFDRKISNWYAKNYNGTCLMLLDYDDKKLIVLDVETRKVVKLLNCKDFKLDDFGTDFLVPNNKSYVIFTGYAGSENMIYLYDLQKDELKATLADDQYRKRYKILKETDSVDVDKIFLLDDERILSSHSDKFLRLWSTTKGTMVMRIPGHRVVSSEIEYIPQSPFVLTYGDYEEQTLRLWDKETMKQIASFKVDLKVAEMKWCPDGKTFITCTSDPVVITRWTVPGISENWDENQITYKGNVTTSREIPVLEFKEADLDPNDIDQEEQAVDTEDDDDDEDDD